jgi:hypothetical protein
VHQRLAGPLVPAEKTPAPSAREGEARGDGGEPAVEGPERRAAEGGGRSTQTDSSRRPAGNLIGSARPRHPPGEAAI